MVVDNRLEPLEIRIDCAHHAASVVERGIVALDAPGGRRDLQPARVPRPNLTSPRSRLVDDRHGVVPSDQPIPRR